MSLNAVKHVLLVTIVPAGYQQNQKDGTGFLADLVRIRLVGMFAADQALPSNRAELLLP